MQIVVSVAAGINHFRNNFAIKEKKSE